MRPVRRLRIDGDSMRPTLLPGDRVVALAVARRRRPRLAPATLVVVRDPRAPQRLMIKRLVAADDDGAVVHGDNPEASTDSRRFGRVPWDLVVGRVVYRYSPADRAGRLTT